MGVGSYSEEAGTNMHHENTPAYFFLNTLKGEKIRIEWSIFLKIWASLRDIKAQRAHLLRETAVLCVLVSY